MEDIIKTCNLIVKILKFILKIKKNIYIYIIYRSFFQNNLKRHFIHSESCDGLIINKVNTNTGKKLMMFTVKTGENYVKGT